MKTDKNAKLHEFQDKYEQAKSKYDLKRFSDRWDQYKGTHEIFNKAGAKVKDADMVYNFTYELIESQVDSFIPPPKVKPQKVTDRTMELAAIIEDMCRNELDRLPMEYLNDEDERSTPVMGGDLFLIEWDNAYKTHDTVGALALKLVNARQFIPQEEVKTLYHMDHIFITFEDTKQRIKDRYGKDVSLESVDQTTSEAEPTEDLVTQVVCYYMAKGKLGCFSWVGDVTLIDDDNYEARKDKICSQCGRTKPMGENKCICGSTEWERRPLENEILMDDIPLSDGSVIPAMSWARNDDGSYALEDYQEPLVDAMTGIPLYDYVFDDQMQVVGEQPRTITQQRPYQVPTKLPYYTPKKFPLCLRKNVSVYGEVLGDSDCDVIKDFQVAANKILSKVNKKTVNSGSLLVKMKNVKYTPSDEDVNPIEVDNIAEMNGVKAVTLSYETAKDLDTVQKYYDMAKSTLGITDTYQGKADPTATSGVAKQLQIAQAAGRQKSKRVMKNAVYADIYETMFKFMLAYADEPRVYNSTDDDGKPVQMVFNRYDFLEQDEYGNWFYNDEFLFSTDEAGAAYNERGSMLEAVQNDFNQGAFGDKSSPEAILLYWKEKEVLNFPNAKRMVSYFEKKVQEQQMLQQQQAMMQQAQMAMMQGGMPGTVPPGQNGGMPV